MSDIDGPSADFCVGDFRVTFFVCSSRESVLISLAPKLTEPFV
jgi:hypothetical protein